MNFDFLKNDNKAKYRIEDLEVEFADLISPIHFINGSIILHEYVEFRQKPNNMNVLRALQIYFASLGLYVLSYQAEDSTNCEPIEFRCSIEIDGAESFCTQNTLEFVDAVLHKLPSAERFSINSFYSGREFRWDDRKKYELSGDLYDFFSNGMCDEKFCYKQFTFYNNHGESTNLKIVDGTTVDLLAEYSTKIIEKEFKNNWDCWNLSICVDFDFEKHADVLERLRAIVKKYIPDEEYVYCADAWENGEPQILINSIGWYMPKLSVVQALLDEINEIILPIKNECDCAADGEWFVDEEAFAVATWCWSDSGFIVVGTEY